VDAKAGAVSVFVVVALMGLLTLCPTPAPSACDRWQAKFIEAEARLDRVEARLGREPEGIYVYQPPESKALSKVARQRPGECPFP
jgi:hypothetical protein